MSRDTSNKTNLIPLAQLGAFLIFLLVMWSLGQNLVGLISMDERLLTAQEELDVLKQENWILQESALSLKSGGHEEAGIRDKLGLVRPGEVVVILPDDIVGREMSTLRTQRYVSVDESESYSPIWRQWVELFL